jgi:hypothetical protein
VDIDPVSVECTKLALMLECRAFGMPWNWLDDNIKCGDALVGLLGGQLRAFHWKLEQPEIPGIYPLVDRAVELGAQARKLRMRDLTLHAETRS